MTNLRHVKYQLSNSRHDDVILLKLPLDSSSNNSCHQNLTVTQPTPQYQLKQLTTPEPLATPPFPL
jgi:hypothetical protein